eukprot:scaffold1822_cov43-Cyclotella_meneghiniana.AAC.2
MKLSFLSLALAPFAVVRGDDLSKYTLLSPAGGGCVDFKKEYYSYTEVFFIYQTYPQLDYSGLVDKCAGWCLQNGPPQYKMLGFETFTKAHADSRFPPQIKCGCQFDGDLPNPLPTYNNPAADDHGDNDGTGPMQAGTDDVTRHLCYALNPPGPPTSRPSAKPSASSSKASKNAKDAKSSSPHAKSAKVGKRG